jgi:O-acetylhomoserine/O-acetylserine sulfhydrylase-like pyridoxal-dependent enzyme
LTEDRPLSPQTLAAQALSETEPDDLLRLSIGIEAPGDLIADLEAALDAVVGGPVPEAAGREAGR